MSSFKKKVHDDQIKEKFINVRGETTSLGKALAK